MEEEVRRRRKERGREGVGSWEALCCLGVRQYLRGWCFERH